MSTPDDGGRYPGEQAPGQAGYGRPGFGPPGYDPSQHGHPSYGQQQHGQQQQYGQPGPGQAYGQPPYGQPYGRPPYGQAPYGQPYGRPPYGQAPYGAPGYGAAPGHLYGRPTNSLAILSLVLAFVFAPAGLITGIIARRQIRQTHEDGDGLALAGIIVGGIVTALFVLMIVFWIVAVVAVANEGFAP